MSGPRIVVFAFSDVGHECLRFLLDRGDNVVAVASYSEPPGPGGWPPSVSQLARSRGVPVMEDVDWSQPVSLERVRALAPELIFSFYYRDLLPEAVLSLPRLGAFNMHGSLLPQFRGRAPVNWAVLEGETRTGATLHVMTAKADAGDIVDQEPVDIGPDETAFEVQRKVVRAAVAVLARQIGRLEEGTAPRRSQDLSKGSYRGRRRPEDGRVDWRWGAERVHNLVRAVAHPYPGAFADIAGKKTYLWQSRVPGLAIHDGYPGHVRIESNRLLVCCGDDRFLEILRLQPEGEPEMTASEWIARHS